MHDKLDKVKVTLMKSVCKKLQAHKDCVRGLGLRKIGHTVEVANTREIQGMIRKVGYLLKVESR